MSVMACFSYLDDSTLTVPMDEAREARDIAMTWLGPVGLRLNVSKCRVNSLTKQKKPRGCRTDASSPHRHGTTASSFWSGHTARKTRGIGSRVPRGRDVVYGSLRAALPETKTMDALQPTEHLPTDAQVGTVSETGSECHALELPHAC